MTNHLCPDGSNPCGEYGYCAHCPKESEDDMTTEQQILSILARHEPLTANEIAQRVGIDRFQLKPLLWRMECDLTLVSHYDSVAKVWTINDAPGAA